MPEAHVTGPALTVALALAGGVLAQGLARHLRVPGIVLLLGLGVALGPDGLRALDPHDLGIGLQTLTGFAVAVILFEGGLNLDLRRLRAQAPPIRRLLSLGALITAGGAALAARLLLGWAWRPAILFGTLVIVTGPTVITPLLRRIRVRRDLETLLESEGVLIDAVGAVVAVVALEVALAPSGSAVAMGIAGVPMRLLAGLGLGAAGGLLLSLLLRRRRLVPEGFANILALSWSLLIFQVGNALVPESGIMAVVATGVVVGNTGVHRLRDLKEFKEQLTVLLIGMLFVLLAADVRLADVAGLGRPGLAVLLALMFVVRPLNVLACTARAGLGWRDKAFLAWVAPRGIVAAAVASLFHERLAAAGAEGGDELRAMVFLVIAGTVFVQGATAEYLARALKLRRPTGKGYAILGAQPFGRLLARMLGEHGQEAVLLDANATLCREAEAEGLRVVYGNAMEESVQFRARMDTRRGAIGALHNEAVNLMFAREARGSARVPTAFALLDRGGVAVTPAQLGDDEVSLLCGVETDPELWSVRLRRGHALVEAWTRGEGEPGPVPPPVGDSTLILPLFHELEDGRLRPVDETSVAEAGDRVHWLIFAERADEARAKLREQGWIPPDPSPPSTV